MNEISSAIYTKLNADLSISVFDNVPQDNYNFPYVRVDPIILDADDTDTESGFSGTVQVIGFSQYKGSKEIVDLTLDIYNSLHRAVLPEPSSYGISTIHQEFSTIALEADGLTRQSIQRFNVVFEPLPA